jgi:hypothetical protein
MIRHGVWMAAAVWILSATGAWAEPPRAVDGPALSCSAAPCGSAHTGNCWQKMKDWLCYHPEARCSDCDCCHNCTQHQPPLFAFFLEYNNLPCTGPVGCHGQTSCAPAGCKTCAPKVGTACAKVKDAHP